MELKPIFQRVIALDIRQAQVGSAPENWRGKPGDPG